MSLQPEHKPEPLDVRVVDMPSAATEERTAADVNSMRTFNVTGGTQSFQILPLQNKRSRAIITHNIGGTGAVFLCKQRDVSSVTALGNIGLLLPPGKDIEIQSAPDMWCVIIAPAAQASTVTVLDEWYSA